jgi:hypothetical protein
MSGAAPVAKQERRAIQTVLTTTLNMAAVEAQVGGEVTAAAPNLLEVWNINNAGLGLVSLVMVLVRKRGRSGPPGSEAASLPTIKFLSLWQVGSHLHFTDNLAPPTLVWSCDRAAVASIRLAPHLQLLRRVSIRFADGSRASFMAQSQFARAAVAIGADR